MKPIYKWMGGKRLVTEELIKLSPSKKYETYYEPFLGGGAMLLALKPQGRVIVGDANKEIVNFWRVMEDRPFSLWEVIGGDLKVSEQEYYRLRALDRNPEELAKLDPLERAKRFITLIGNCFGGVWRCNRKGQNNMPYTDRIVARLDKKNFNAVSDYIHFGLDEFIVREGDYRTTLSDMQEGDFTYLDPPYASVDVRYNGDTFDHEAFVHYVKSMKGEALVSHHEPNAYMDLYNEHLKKVYEVPNRWALQSPGSKKRVSFETAYTK